MARQFKRNRRNLVAKTTHQIKPPYPPTPRARSRYPVIRASLLITMKTFTIAAIALATIAVAQAQSLGGSFLIQRKATLAVVVAPVKVLWTKGPLSISLDGLVGANVTTNEPAIGGAVAAHWQKASWFSFDLGLGTTYQASRFQFSDINKNSVGILVGGTFKF